MSIACKFTESFTLQGFVKMLRNISNIPLVLRTHLFCRVEEVRLIPAGEGGAPLAGVLDHLSFMSFRMHVV